MQIRKAVKNDARALAELIDLAGDGIPSYLWQQMKADNQTVLEFGEQRAAREEGGFSYSQAWVAEQDGEVSAMVLGYVQPDPYDLDEINDAPEYLYPIIELEALAPGSWYVNALATFDQFQGKGLGSQLLSTVNEAAIAEGCAELSLIVSSENSNAKRLYEKLGFIERSCKPIIQIPGLAHSGNWILMIKES